MEDRVRNIIIKYGSAILSTDTFKKTFEQKHHLHLTVGDHTLGVTEEAVRMCLNRGIIDSATLKNVVTASLCHDLGIMGRKEKFKNVIECHTMHPEESVKAYRELTGEDDPRVVNAILHHMFPIKPGRPKYVEGWILTAADKKASVKEKTGTKVISDRDRMELLSC